MFGKTIWDKLPECIFENFEINRVKRGEFQYFQKSTGVIYPKNRPNQTCGDWLITRNQQLQNNFVNGAVYYNEPCDYILFIFHRYSFYKKYCYCLYQILQY